jgi:hypothetical protein
MEKIEQDFSLHARLGGLSPIDLIYKSFLKIFLIRDTAKNFGTAFQAG